MGFLGILLFPFTLLYDLATRVRNYLFDIGYKTSFEFDRCIINVGNLSVGGTGKSPMVEYLIRLLKTDHKIATLSRGYGRKTKGFRIAGAEDTAGTLGDEPFQFHAKFEEVTVTVGEERAVAIPFILAEKPDTEVIILDDAYQHRYVKPNFNILLTSYHKPFYDDWVLPSGRLRESRNGARRADCVILTKCPEAISKEERDQIKSQIQRYSNGLVYFSKIEYKDPVPVLNSRNDWSDKVFLFTGIANPLHLQQYVKTNYNLIEELHFGDHHQFTVKDIDQLISIANDRDLVFLTTEKDMVRLLSDELKQKIKELPLFYIPIETRFIEDGEKFDSSVLKIVKSNLH